MAKLLECVPNISEGRNSEVIEAVVDVVRHTAGVALLDYSSDPSHNRTVITFLGEPQAVAQCAIDLAGKAVELIDLTKHQGEHPRMGAVDVIPFIPIKEVTKEEAVEISKQVGQKISDQFQLPVFLYEDSASAPHRVNLADVRKGQFEGMAEKMKDPMWKPDYGPDTIHPTGGVTAIGARMPLIAYNINLDTPNVEIASAIAKTIRNLNGGFRYCKAMGVHLEDRNLAQVSMNLTDFTQTAMYRVFETVKMEARRYGVHILGSEIVGLVPQQALLDCAAYYLQLENFDGDQVLENRL